MIKLLELFGGIGACSAALERLGIEYQIADYVEINKYSVMSYNAIHDTNFEPQDITKWDKNIEIDLIMHGSPCQDFSIAGKNAGGDKDSGTRSSLMYETIRIVEKLKPKYVIWENVKNLLSQKHKHNFDAYIQTMANLGYKSFYKVLNAKDFGIPQNRERVFTVSIYGGGQGYNFPEAKPLEIRLKDVLEKEVEEKYYLSKADSITITENYIQYDNRGKKYNSQASRLYYQDGLCPTQPANNSGDKNQVVLMDKKDFKILVREATQKGYAEAYEGDSINLENPNSQTRRGRVGHGVAQTLTTSPQQATVINMCMRRLTPKECWRLMGFTDEEFNKAQAVNSNTQLYKQAGNSIVVDVLVAILNNLLNMEAIEDYKNQSGYQLTFDDILEYYI